MKNVGASGSRRELELVADCFFDLCFGSIVVPGEVGDRLARLVAVRDHEGGDARTRQDRASELDLRVDHHEPRLSEQRFRVLPLARERIQSRGAPGGITIDSSKVGLQQLPDGDLTTFRSRDEATEVLDEDLAGLGQTRLTNERSGTPLSRAARRTGLKPAWPTTQARTIALGIRRYCVTSAMRYAGTSRGLSERRGGRRAGLGVPREASLPPGRRPATPWSFPPALVDCRRRKAGRLRPKCRNPHRTRSRCRGSTPPRRVGPRRPQCEWERTSGACAHSMRRWPGLLAGPS